MGNSSTKLKKDNKGISQIFKIPKDTKYDICKIFPSMIITKILTSEESDFHYYRNKYKKELSKLQSEIKEMDEILKNKKNEEKILWEEYQKHVDEYKQKDFIDFTTPVDLIFGKLMDYARKNYKAVMVKIFVDITRPMSNFSNKDWIQYLDSTFGEVSPIMEQYRIIESLKYEAKVYEYLTRYLVPVCPSFVPLIGYGTCMMDVRNNRRLMRLYEEYFTLISPNNAPVGIIMTERVGQGKNKVINLGEFLSMLESHQNISSLEIELLEEFVYKDEKTFNDMKREYCMTEYKDEIDNIRKDTYANFELYDNKYNSVESVVENRIMEMCDTNTQNFKNFKRDYALQYYELFLKELEREEINIFFQLIYALSLLQINEIFHNDLHTRNILLEYNKNYQKIDYRVGKDYYTVITRYKAYIIDWNKASLHTEKNPFLENKHSKLIGESNSYNPRKDLYTLVCNCNFPPFLSEYYPRKNRPHMFEGSDIELAEDYKNHVQNLEIYIDTSENYFLDRFTLEKLGIDTLDGDYVNIIKHEDTYLLYVPNLNIYRSLTDKQLFDIRRYGIRAGTELPYYKLSNSDLRNLIGTKNYNYYFQLANPIEIIGQIRGDKLHIISVDSKLCKKVNLTQDMPTPLYLLYNLKAFYGLRSNENYIDTKYVINIEPGIQDEYKKETVETPRYPRKTPIQEYRYSQDRPIEIIPTITPFRSRRKRGTPFSRTINRSNTGLTPITPMRNISEELLDDSEY